MINPLNQDVVVKRLSKAGFVYVPRKMNRFLKISYMYAVVFPRCLCLYGADSAAEV